MNYYSEIKQNLINNELTQKVKDYSKNRSILTTYYNVGKLLNEAGKHYGEGIIKEYSKRLTSELGKAYDYSSLSRMRQFYLVFQNVAPVEQLSWSHYKILLPLKDTNEINYYINQTIIRNLSKRQLQNIIKLNEYKRLSGKTKEKLISKRNTKVTDLIKNPIIIKNTHSYDVISEKILQKLILEDISSFLEQLGNGFTFIKNEFKIKIGNRNNYIDLLLFNIEYNCYVVVELKVTEYKAEYLGQTLKYVNYVDSNLKKPFHNKTIGIIMCKENDQFVLKYATDSRILNTTYQLI